MTSTTVTEKNNFFSTVTNNVSAPNAQKDAFTDCFAQAYNQKDSMQSEKQGNDINLPKNTNPKETMEQVKGNSLKDKGITAEKEPLDVTEANEKLSEITEEVMEAIAAQLGIPVEQVMQVMKELGMTQTDILDTANLMQLVTALSGGEGQMDLLTNENLFQTVKQLTKTVEELKTNLQSELGIGTEELEAMIGKLSAAEKTVSQEPGIKENQVLPEDQMEKPVTPVEKQLVIEVQIDKNVPKITTESETPAAPTQNTVTVKETNPPKQEQQNQHEGDKEAKPQNILQPETMVDKLNKAFALEEVVESHAQTADTEHIMKQIMDYMKIQVKADLTQMEIQLHPASLGNINVQIASKGGMITAQFTAQNEAVKAALETQIVQLKETLQEQGVKVEAVEVTIASHGFERNLNQNQSEHSNADQNSKKGNRRINLNLGEMDGEEEAGLNEAEQITADMMVQNGSTVDFSA